MRVCYLQDSCPQYITGDNKPPNNHVRLTVPCRKSVVMSCEMETAVRLFYGETIACNLEKVQRIKQMATSG